MFKFLVLDLPYITSYKGMTSGLARQLFISERGLVKVRKIRKETLVIEHCSLPRILLHTCIEKTIYIL